MAEYIVELLLVVEADAGTDAEALGERAAKEAAKAHTPRSAGKARIVNVILSDVRHPDDADQADRQPHEQAEALTKREQAIRVAWMEADVEEELLAAQRDIWYLAWKLDETRAALAARVPADPQDVEKLREVLYQARNDAELLDGRNFSEAKYQEANNALARLAAAPTAAVAPDVRLEVYSGEEGSGVTRHGTPQGGTRLHLRDAVAPDRQQDIETLLERLWDATKPDSSPLWWCLADEHKAAFRARLAAPTTTGQEKRDG